jgi:acyl carrier protein
MKDTYEGVKDILTKKLGIVESEITLEANLVRDLGIDSLDYAEIVMEFEQTFDIKIPDQDAEKLTTVGESVNYINSKLAEKTTD